MKVKAIKSFSGTVCMHVGEVREVERSATIDELIRIGYLEEVKAKPAPEKTETSETEVKTDEAKRGKSKRN